MSEVNPTLEWDALTLIDWSLGAHPQPFVLSLSTLGCGCCADGKTIRSKEEALPAVEAYIQEREAEIAHWREWLHRMTTATEIVK